MTIIINNISGIHALNVFNGNILPKNFFQEAKFAENMFNQLLLPIIHSYKRYPTETTINYSKIYNYFHDEFHFQSAIFHLQKFLNIWSSSFNFVSKFLLPKDDFLYIYNINLFKSFRLDHFYDNIYNTKKPYYQNLSLSFIENLINLGLIHLPDIVITTERYTEINNLFNKEFLGKEFLEKLLINDIYQNKIDHFLCGTINHFFGKENIKIIMPDLIYRLIKIIRMIISFQNNIITAFYNNNLFELNYLIEDDEISFY